MFPLVAQNKELLSRIDELNEEIKLLSQDVVARDDRIDKLNEASFHKVTSFTNSYRLTADSSVRD